MMAYRSQSTAMTFSTDVGFVRVGSDCQIVDYTTGHTLANSDEAQPWSREHATGETRQRLLCATRAPGQPRSPIDDIATRGKSVTSQPKQLREHE